MRPIVRFCLVANALASPVFGQAAVIIDIDDPTLLPGQSTTITLSAFVPPADYLLAGVQADLVSSAGNAGLSDLLLLAPLDGPGTVPGEIGSTGVEGIIAGQLNFPVGSPPDQPNPIGFWQATYTAPVVVSDPFDVMLSTQTIRFDVYASRDDILGESRLDGLVEGDATIRVIPAPASTLALSLGLIACGRRR